MSHESPYYPPHPAFTLPPPVRHGDVDDDDSSSESKSEDEHEQWSCRPVPRRRPSIRYAAPTLASDGDHRPRPQTVIVQRQNEKDRERERASRAERQNSVNQALVVSHIKYQSEYPTSRGQVIVEIPRSDRRLSLQQYSTSYKGRERVISADKPPRGNEAISQ